MGALADAMRMFGHVVERRVFQMLVSSRSRVSFAWQQGQSVSKVSLCSRAMETFYANFWQEEWFTCVAAVMKWEARKTALPKKESAVEKLVEAEV